MAAVVTDKNGLVFPVGAGSTIHFILAACDRFYNKHISGDAIKSVVIKGGGKYRSNARVAEDAVCSVSYSSDGNYNISCQVCAVGWHDIVVTDFYMMKYVMGRVKVFSGPPYGSNCKLSEFNTYEARVGEKHFFTVELFDKFMNRAFFRNSIERLDVHATIGEQTLDVFSGIDAYQLHYTSYRSSDYIVLLFIPDDVGRFFLQISIRGNSLSSCPVPFYVHLPTFSLREKLERLKTCFSKISMGYTRTLTVDRYNLLESTVRVLKNCHFFKIIRIRFGDEVGIDQGGVARYVFN